MQGQVWKKNYGDYITPELLAKWQGDPQNAPGRMTSSPWPDRIEISNIERQPDGSYIANGKIIENNKWCTGERGGRSKSGL